MKRFLVSILLIICLIILNNKIKDKVQKDLHEGFTQCEYRKKQNTGKMCKEKWGEPECSQWKPTKRLIKLEKHHSKPHNHFVSLRGYQSNSFLYEIDYDEENEVEEGGEEEGACLTCSTHSHLAIASSARAMYVLPVCFAHASKLAHS